MKLMIAVMVLGVVMACGSGCIGPVSSWNLDRIRDQKLQRSVMKSDMPIEKKQKLFYAMASGDDRDVTVGAGVDLLALANTSYTWSEAGSQALAVGGELATYYFAGKMIYDAATHDDDPEPATPVQTIPTQSGTYNIYVNNSGAGDVNVGVNGAETGVVAGPVTH